MTIFSLRGWAFSHDADDGGDAWLFGDLVPSRLGILVGGVWAGAWQLAQWERPNAMAWSIRSAGNRWRRRPGCPGWPPARPERFLTTGGWTPGGLAEGGTEELEAF